MSRADIGAPPPQASSGEGDRTSRDDAGGRPSEASLLAAMSHEFRTPLTTVLGMLQLLETSPLDGEQRRCLETAERAGRRLLALSENLVRYAALQAGDARFEAKPVDLLEEVEAAGDMMRLDAREKGLKLTVDVEGSLAAPRIGDAQWIRLAIVNLLDNAVKFTAEGEIALTAKPVQGDGISVLVTDTGLPIDEAQPFLDFDKEGPGAEASTRRYGGAGLGLAIARRIIELMGGRLDARSREAGGTEFEIALELPRAEKGVVTAAPARARVRRKVLIAEDNPTNQRLIKLIVENLGHETQVVDNGKLAVEAVSVEAFDVVVMDVHMPVMDGVSAAKAIRARNDARSQVPILALTADIRPEIEKLTREAGINAFLEKPIELAKLAAAIETLAANAETAASPSA